MDIPSADWPPIELKCTEPNYTKPLEPIEKWGDPPLLINPTCTESYYTKPVEPIKKYAYTQCRWTPQLIPSVQSPTTPNQYNILRNEEVFLP